MKKESVRLNMLSGPTLHFGLQGAAYSGGIGGTAGWGMARVRVGDL